MRQRLLSLPDEVKSQRGLSILVFVLALLPRLTAVNRYITPDELMWVYRSVLFREALLAGDWLNTLTAGHPGVTTTWLGAAAVSIQMTFQPEQQAVYVWLTRLAWLSPDNMEAFTRLASFLTGGRALVAVVNSVGITAVFLLTRKLLPRAVAAVSVLLMAFEPFLVGLSGLLHVDALLTTFATISLLALGVALVAEMPLRRRGWYTAVSGIMAALALLTKSPALLLLPLSLAFISLKWWPAWRVDIRGRWRTLFALFGAWLLAFIVTLFAIFPALWTSPTQVAHLMSSNANRHIEEALRPTYFL